MKTTSAIKNHSDSMITYSDKPVHYKQQKWLWFQF